MNELVEARYLLQISTDFKLDLKDYEKEGIRIFISGISGSGKSNSAKVIAEEILKIPIPLIILDPEGEYASLRERFESIIIIGGKYADIPLTEYIIEELITLQYESGVSLIFDISELFEQKQIEYSAEIMKTLYYKATKYRKPIFLFVEECSLIAPEKIQIKSSKFAKEIISKGRKRGIHSIWISQRTAFVSKDIISQCNIRMIGKLIENNDIIHIKDILKNANLSKVEILNLTQEFFLITKKFKDKIKFRKAEIRDLSQTPLFEEEIKLIDKKNSNLENILNDLLQKAELKKKQEFEKADYIQELEGKLNEVNFELDEKSKLISRLQHDLEIVSNIKITQETPSKDLNLITTNLQEKENLINQLQEESKYYKIQTKEQEKKVKELEATIDNLSKELNEASNIVNNLNEIKTIIFKLSKLFNFDFGDVQFYKEKINQQEKIISQLSDLSEFNLIDFNNKLDFLTHPEVKKATEKAIETAGKAIIQNILTFLIQEDRPVTYKEIAEAYGYQTNSNISKGSTALEKELVIKKINTENGLKIDFNLESLPSIIKKQTKIRILKKKSQELFNVK